MELEAEWQKFMAVDMSSEDYESVDIPLSQLTVENNQAKKQLVAPMSTVS